MNNNIKETILIRTLENAYKFKGKANTKAVLGKILSDNPQLKNSVKEIIPIIEETVKKVNSMTVEEQKSKLEILSPTTIEKKKVQEEKKLPPLPNVEKYEKIIMRLAPYPSGPLHIGNVRMVILNDEYVKKYNGLLYLVYDDTIGSEKKVILPEAYDYIKEDLDWLNVKIHKEFYKSDRLELFYKWCRKLIELNKAYVCTCDAEIWRKEYKLEKKACPCRNSGVEENLEKWEKMLGGNYGEGDAAVRLKTGMDLDDPALRDHVIMRISNKIHPRVGDKYRVWPLLEFSWAIDDYELNITHILRGKDLVKEDRIEEIIWELLNLSKREFIHYGRIRFQGISLSKSKSAQYVREGKYFSWRDPRTWSIPSLKARGFRPDVIREAILDLGLSLSDIEYSPEILYAQNRKTIDPMAERLFFVDSQVKLAITEIDRETLLATPPKHPDYPERGVRKIELNVENKSSTVLITRKDFDALNINQKIRLKDLINIEVYSKKSEVIEARAISYTIEEARSEGIKKIIHWVPTENNIVFHVIMVDGNKISGVAEPYAATLKPEKIIQLERFGFVRVDQRKEKNGEVEITAFYTHK
ncbi:MAG: glutamate--tRNA ligase [Candidatus Odinarchaeia archaeon]